MLSQNELDKYMENIPAIPSILRACKIALEEGDMIKAADLASKDKVVLSHFQNIVNKPIFGFSEELTNARQIFGALGLVRVKQIFNSYYSMLLAPKKWNIFKITTAQFQEIQASFIVRWEIILKEKGIKNEEMLTIVTLIPAAIAVCENIFQDHKETIDMIKSQKALSYEAILYKMSGYDFFDIVKKIAIKWDFSEQTVDVLGNLKKIEEKENLEDWEILIIYFMLLINYEISRPIAIKSGINELFELNLSYPTEIIEDFYEIMVKAEK